MSINPYTNREWAVIEGPSVEPVTVDEVKLYARIDGTEEDTLLSSFIIAARKSCEQYLGRALIKQKMALLLNEWPDKVIELPRPPLFSVDSIVTIGEDGTEITYDSSNYYVMNQTEPGKLIIKQSSANPYQIDRSYGGYKITFYAGYGTSASDVPNAIRDGLKAWVTHIYENRTVRMDEPPLESKILLDLYRVCRIG